MSWLSSPRKSTQNLQLPLLEISCAFVVGKTRQNFIPTKDLLHRPVLVLTSPTSRPVNMADASDNESNRYSPEFLRAGSEILQIHNYRARLKTAYELFHHNFKYSPSRCAFLFLSIRYHPLIPAGYEPKHLLWTLYFLLTYATERRLCCILQADRKTIRKYTWPTISAIASLLPRHVSMTHKRKPIFFPVTSHLFRDPIQHRLINSTARFVGRTGSLVIRAEQRR